MKSLVKKIAGVALAALCTTAVAASAAGAGTVDFNDLSAHYGPPKVEINLSALMLGFVANASQKSTPELAQALSNIQTISVRVYKLNDDPTHALSTVQHTAARMKKNAWEPMISVREEKENVQIFSKMVDGKMAGLVVMVVDSSEENEAVFINIVGEIDPSQLSQVLNSLNLNVGETQ